MKKNMSSADSIIRLIFALVIGILVYSTITISITGITLLFAGVFALTAVFKFCPIYVITGFNT